MPRQETIGEERKDTGERIGHLTEKEKRETERIRESQRKIERK